MNADQAATGLAAFNSMLHAWELDGIALSYSDLGLSDAFPLAAKFVEGTGYTLAGRLAHGYSAPLSFDPDGFFRKIQAAYTTIAAATLPSGILRTPSQRRYSGDY